MLARDWPASYKGEKHVIFPLLRQAATFCNFLHAPNDTMQQQSKRARTVAYLAQKRVVTANNDAGEMRKDGGK